MASLDMYNLLQSVAAPQGGGVAAQLQTMNTNAAQARTRRSAMLEQALSSLKSQGMANPGTGISGGGGGGGYAPSRNPRGVGLTTITAPDGERVTVAANYASKFSGLLRDLWNAGYHYKSVGGYNYRNIAGTNTLSKHATGEAIDIDPGANPVTYGTAKTYFNPNTVIPILRKYGLDWGYLWTGKKDPMHFSTGG
jgi:hypothetical protein